MELPQDGDWIFKHELDSDGHLTVLFCMHRSCVEMLRRHPWVLSMDCTYKTNRYGLPLLDIVSLVSTGQTCFIAFAFIRDEKQDTYETVLKCLAEAYRALNLQYPRTILTDKERALINAINTVFPETKIISCIWHIEMNLLKKARPLLSDQLAIARRDGLSLPNGLDQPTQPDQPKTKEQLQDELRKIVDKGWKKMLQRWNQVVYATSEDVLNQRWALFQEQYKDPIFQPILQYIQSEWLDDCPEQFLHLYTSHYLHLGETATSRTEAAHWLLKKDLQTSTNDLLKVLENFQRAIERQYTNIRHQTAIEQHRRPTKLDSLYKLIINRISMRAIRHIEKVANHYLPKGADGKAPIPFSCLYNSKETTGFPCIHLIKQYQDEHRSLEPELFHQHWHLYDLAEAPPIDPLLLV